MGTLTSIRVHGRVDGNHHLLATVPESISPGPVDVLILLRDDGTEEPSWMNFVANEWREELQDTREDIYSLTDGVPVNDAR